MRAESHARVSVAPCTDLLEGREGGGGYVREAWEGSEKKSFCSFAERERLKSDT